MSVPARLLSALTTTLGNDDGAANIVHLVLVLVLLGILVSSSLEVLQHRYGYTAIPGCATSTLVGLAAGGIIRLLADGPEDIPVELSFSGQVFFIVVLPIVIFEVGFSLCVVGGRGWVER